MYKGWGRPFFLSPTNVLFIHNGGVYFPSPLNIRGCEFVVGKKSSHGNAAKSMKVDLVMMVKTEMKALPLLNTV